MKTLIISDVHLGSDVCQAKLLSKFLEDISSDDVEKLIINGDLFDDSNFHRLTKHHWHVLSLIRKLSDIISVIHIRGNHELPTDLLSILIGVNVVDNYVLESGDRKIYIHHGHRYDKFITNHPIITWIGDAIYVILQKIDPSFALARSAKHTSKTFMRNSDIIKNKSIEYAIKHGYTDVIASHTHFAQEYIEENKPRYYNTGCWTEIPCSFLSVDNGQIKLHKLL